VQHEQISYYKQEKELVEFDSDERRNLLKWKRKEKDLKKHFAVGAVISNFK